MRREAERKVEELERRPEELAPERAEQAEGGLNFTKITYNTLSMADDSVHGGEIDVLSFHWGVSQT